MTLGDLLQNTRWVRFGKKTKWSWGGALQTPPHRELESQTQTEHNWIRCMKGPGLAETVNRKRFREIQARTKQPTQWIKHITRQETRWSRLLWEDWAWQTKSKGLQCEYEVPSAVLVAPTEIPPLSQLTSVAIPPVANCVSMNEYQFREPLPPLLH